MYVTYSMRVCMSGWADLMGCAGKAIQQQILSQPCGTGQHQFDDDFIRNQATRFHDFSHLETQGSLVLDVLAKEVAS